MEPGEEIIAVFHRHPFVMLQDLTRIAFFGYLLPIFLYILFPEFILFYVIWMFISFIRLIYLFLTWYHDSILLTSVSVLDICWTGFFNRSASRLEYPMIEGVSYEIKGFIRTMFNYGTVIITRNSQPTPFTLHDAINPQKIERMVMEHHTKFVSDQNSKDASSLKNLLTNIIRSHINGGN
jgi:hypothetical protein